MATSYSDPSALLGAHYPGRKHPRQYLVRMLLIMTAVSFVTATLFCRSCAFGSEDYWVACGYTFSYSMGLWLANSYPAAWLNRQANWVAQPVRRFLITLGLSVGLSLLVILLVTGGFRVFYHHRPLSSLTWQPFIMPLLTTVVVSLFFHSRSFLLSWREAAIRTEQAEKEAAVARLDSLRRQVDPHFLFNSLNALTSLVEEDPTRAVRFIRQLSTVYRYVLDSQDQEVVPLAEEIGFAEAYLSLQRTRLGAGLSVQFQLPPDADLERYLVPPLALQLLLENALKHNATSQRQPLQIDVALDLTTNQLTVSNSLLPRTVAEESTGLGLNNLRARYGFLTDKPVQIERTPDKFVVTLPVLEMAG